MKYSALHTRIESVFTTMGISFQHYPETKFNTYRGTFPCALLDPPLATGKFTDLHTYDQYEIRIAFMNLLPQDNTGSTTRDLVFVQWDEAKEFLARLQQVSENDQIGEYEIQPFFNFSFSSHLTCGVLLSFVYSSLDDFNYCL